MHEQKWRKDYIYKSGLQKKLFHLKIGQRVDETCHKSTWLSYVTHVVEACYVRLRGAVRVHTNKSCYTNELVSSSWLWTQQHTQRICMHQKYLQQKPTKETNRRDQQKSLRLGPTTKTCLSGKETWKRGLHAWEIYKRDLPPWLEIAVFDVLFLE